MWKEIQMQLLSYVKTVSRRAVPTGILSTVYLSHFYNWRVNYTRVCGGHI